MCSATFSVKRKNIHGENKGGKKLRVQLKIAIILKST
jgi:hypothetical protein